MKFNYVKREVALSSTKAHLYGLISIVPLLIILGLPFWILWEERITLKSFVAAIPQPVVLFLVIIGGIVLHELIHGVTWSFFCKTGLKAIRFGIMWKSLTPYCNCLERLKIKQYIVGGIMPAVTMGFLPSIYSIITGNLTLFLVGFFFAFAASGDFVIIWMLRKENKNSFVLDHPKKIGCYVFDKIEDCDC